MVNKKNRHAGATAKRNEESSTVKQIDPVNNNTTKADEKQDFFVAPLLSKGSENSISTVELLRRTGYPSKRVLTKQIERERRAGQLIVSKVDAEGGYFLAARQTELAQYVHMMHSRAVNIFKTIQPARLALKIMESEAADNDK